MKSEYQLNVIDRQLHSGGGTNQEKILMNILDNLDANIYVSDLETDEVLFVNKRMQREFALAHDVRGEKCWRVFQSGMTGRCSFCPSDELVINPGKAIVWEEYNTATGKYYKNTDSAIEWLDGRLVHLQHSVCITAEKEMVRRLEEAKTQAESASQAKGEFLSRVSHEIRTPINAIIGMARIAAATNDLDKLHDCVKKVDSSSKQLLGLINDILDISNIEANKMELFIEPFDFEKMLIDVSNSIAVKTEAKQQKLHIHMDMSMCRFFKGDDMRIAQVITNLLSNAVKFTPRLGVIRMDVCEKESQNGKSLVEVKIADTGIGIAPERQKVLFNSFEQADGGIARKFSGIGLGLTISKKIVEMMGGQISVKSNSGQGSVFTFCIPLEYAGGPAVKREPFKGVDISKIKVLLLDGAADSREYFSDIMKTFNIAATTCATVDECWRVLKEAEEKNYFFNMIFIDGDIAENTSPELCAQIKSRSASSIIIMTSVSQLREQSLLTEKHGVSSYIAKPFFPSMLFDVINKTIGLPPNKADIAQINRYLFSGYHILLAEDTEINREVIYQALEDTKIKITGAVDGRQAVDLFAANPAGYDLILMDVNMPELNGYEAVQKIRALPNDWAKKIPILAMTANAFSTDAQKSLQSGMDDHMTKPIKFDVLFDKLHSYLTGRQQYLQALKAGAPVKNIVKGEEIMDAEGFIDVKDGLGRLKGNAKVYKTLLLSFLKHSHFDELQQAFINRNAEAAAQTAHLIKGVSANMSLVAINKNIVALEEKLKSGVFDEDIFNECLDSFEKTKEAINSLLEKM